MWKEKYQAIQFEEQGGVLLVQFCRADELNVINARLHTELSWLFRDISDDSSCKAVVLTGKGAAFSAGGDINWFAHMTQDELDQLFIEARRLIIDLLETPQPIISAVNGPAVGLGATLALFSDIIYMGRSALIADTHVLAGIAAGDGGASIWPWIIGMPRAKEFLFTGQKIDAQMAEKIGLVNHIEEDDQLLEASLRMAHRLANGPQMALRATKAALNKVLRDTVNLNLDTALAMEKECFKSEEHTECIHVFLNKRRTKTA
ncbi:MAG: enoyl-CoA hydratase-related protein [Alcaligenaceae bacterium]|nr:enoyl-CoA hydratase-related protein [Alcaligenaceae bacterium]